MDHRAKYFGNFENYLSRNMIRKIKLLLFSLLGSGRKENLLFRINSLIEGFNCNKTR